MISYRGITKTFGALRVLDDIHLDVQRGEVTAIVGPNGSGKSTLIKLLLGLVRPDHGQIVFDRHIVDGDAQYRAGIGYMPQRAAFPENLSGAQVLRMLRELRTETESNDELIDVFGIRGELDKPIRTLSGGTRQKLNAVAAFLFPAPLLVLDEPTAGLDPMASSQLKDRILRERADGRTILLTSHNSADLEELADRVVFLLDGRVRFHGTVEELSEQTGEPRMDRSFAALIRPRRQAAV